jgi:HemY protein
MKAGLVDRNAYRRQRAVLLTARAIAAEETDPAGARSLSLEAVKLEPTFVPAAALAGRLLGEAGDLRRAGRLVEAAWRANPHPDLAETYAHLRPGSSARDRLGRVQALAQMAPGHSEGALAVGRGALDAQEFATARQALAPLLAAPTQRVAMLMAVLEESESGDRGRAREWMARAMHARRDPAWTADGVVSDRWMPISPVTGRLDAFQWKEPLAELGGRALLESEAKALAALIAPRPASAMAPSRPDGKAADADADADVVDALRLDRHKTAVPAVPPAVIPLVHVPDDPGPDGDVPSEPQTEGPEKTPDGWSRLRGMFR